MQNGNIRFFENGLQLVKGNGELKTSLARLVRLAAEGVQSTGSSFYAVHDEEKVLIPVITYGLPSSYVEACGNVRIGDQCCGRAVQYRKPWIVADMLKDPLFAAAKEAANVSPIRAGFSVPVIAGTGRCIGSLGCHYPEPYMPTPEQVRRNQELASMIAHTVTGSQVAS